MGAWRTTELVGVLRREVAWHEDERGAFGELWRAEWTEGLDAGDPGGPGVRAAMRQANLSRSAPGVLRGLHCHRRQADLWVVAEGHPLVALVDIRPAVGGTGMPRVLTFDASPGDAVYLPALVAHGFYARDPVGLVYLVTNEYDGSDELGFAWDDPAVGVPWPDPAVGVPWPDRSPILSARDAAAGPLAELLGMLREAGGRTGE